MPIDASIPLQARTPDINPVIQNYFSAKREKRQGRLDELTLSNAEKEAKKKERLKEMAQRFSKPDGTWDRPGMVNALRQEGWTTEEREFNEGMRKKDEFAFRKKQAEQNFNIKKQTAQDKEWGKLLGTYSKLPSQYNEDGTPNDDESKSLFYVDNIAPFIQKTTGQFPQGTFDARKDQELMAEAQSQAALGRKSLADEFAIIDRRNKGKGDLAILLSAIKTGAPLSKNQESQREIAIKKLENQLKALEIKGEALGITKEKHEIVKDEKEAEIELSLTKHIDEATNALTTIDKMVGNKQQGIPQHPGFSGAVGRKNWSSGFGLRDEPLDGSPEAGFMSYYKQIKGKAFLSAFQALKGGGHITEIEGEKAEQAQNRMDRATSEYEFISAANEFKGIINEGIERAKKEAETKRIKKKAKMSDEQKKRLKYLRSKHPKRK